MNYAMIIENRVIDVIKDVSKAPVYPPDMLGRPVITVECDETVHINMEYIDGKFVEPTPEPPKSEIPLSPTEQTLMQMAVNMEYLATMMEFKQ